MTLLMRWHCCIEVKSVLVVYQGLAYLLRDLVESTEHVEEVLVSHWRAVVGLVQPTLNR